MKRHDFEAMRAALRGGVAVQVAVAPQLYPTPPDVAARMVEFFDSWAGEAWHTMRVLEPSAGTGNLIAALMEEWPGAEVVGYEVNQALVDQLRRKNTHAGVEHYQADFLEVLPTPTFDAVLMNPPFSGFDWKHHTRHAWRFLKPGGRMVALLPQSPRVRDVVREMDPHATFEPLPDDTFASTGAKVRTLLAILNKPEEA